MISLGQTAYDTYRRILNSVPPPWENLPGDVQVAWEKAASTVSVTTHQMRTMARFGDGKTRDFLFYHHLGSNDFSVIVTTLDGHPVTLEHMRCLSQDKLALYFGEDNIPGAGDQQYIVELRMNKHAENP